jgi:integrase
VGPHGASRDDAKQEADQLRTLIPDGQFPFDTPKTATPSALTFDAFALLWQDRARVVTSETQRKSDLILLRRLGNLMVYYERLLDRLIGRLTEDDFQTAFLQVGDLPASTHNKLRQTLIHLQRWGVKKGDLSSVWLTPDSDLKRKNGARRERRLNPDEEAALLQHATSWLRNLIVACLESCCRRGELLSLQWRDVSLARAKITLRAQNTKPGELRRLPVSRRLLGVLEHVRTGPTGQPQPPDAYVFGAGSADGAWIRRKRGTNVAD